MRLTEMLLVALLMVGGTTFTARSEATGAPDVLVLGDSQLSFGAGKAIVELMNDIAGSCGLKADTSTGVIGVRSSTIQSWTGSSKKAKGAICNADPKWNVNAGAYGTLSPGENPYVQIGNGAQFQFCAPGQSPLQAVFAGGYYAPDLVIFFMMGNAAERWAESPEAALTDVRALMADLPRGQPCIFMTSAPPYREKSVKVRLRAQENLERAFASAGGQCSFVPGLTEATIRENMDNPTNFRRSSSGKVKDPYHPTEAAARRFMRLQRDALCKAISGQLGGG
jgi:hypothetical protein